jgi:hypothetical protein
MLLRFFGQQKIGSIDANKDAKTNVLKILDKLGKFANLKYEQKFTYLIQLFALLTHVTTVQDTIDRIDYINTSFIYNQFRRSFS